jgi:hypothetical protein
LWVVRLAAVSSLTKLQLRSEYLVVGLTIHDRLQVAQCRSHERSDPLRELLDWRTAELICRYHELRDTPLGLFGVELSFLKGLVAPRLVVAFSLTPRGISVGLSGTIFPFSAPRYDGRTPDKVLAIDDKKLSFAETGTAAPSFGEFFRLPGEGGRPSSHHTSSSPSANSSRPCFPKERWTTLWAVTSPSYPTGWSSRSWLKSWCSAPL